MIIKSIHPMYEKSVVISVSKKEFEKMTERRVRRIAINHFKEIYGKLPEKFETIRDEATYSVVALDK